MKTAKLTLMTTCMLLALGAMASRAGAQTMLQGEDVIGQLAGPADVQTFTMDMAQGDTLRMRMLAAGDGAEAPSLAVMTPAGATLGSVSGNRELDLTVEAPVTGTYTLRVAASLQSSTGYRLLTRGEKVRKYEARDGEPLTFGVIRGAVVRILAKAPGSQAESGPLSDAQGNQVLLTTSRDGGRHRSYTAALPAVGDLTLVWGGERLRVKVRYPAPRGDILVQPSPAGGTSAGQMPRAEGESFEPTPEDEVRYDLLLPGLMRGEMDADLVAAREALQDLGEVPAGMAAAMLDDLEGSEISGRMLRAMNEQALSGRPMDPGAADRMIAILDADRRNAAATERLALLESELPGTALAGEPTFDAAMIDAAAELNRIRDALMDATGPDVEAALWGDADAYLGTQLPPSGAANLRGAAELNRHVVYPRVLPRARAGEMTALDLTIALYGTIEQMIAENADATRRQERQAQGMAATRRALEAIREEIRSRLVLTAEMDQPVMGRATEILVRVEGIADHSELEWTLMEADGGIELDPQPEGLHVHCPADLTDRIIRIGAELGERSGLLEIPFHPVRVDTVEIRGVAVDGGDSAVPGASVELREDSADGPLATALGGEPLETLTGDDGEFVLPEVCAGVYVLIITAPGGEAERLLTVDPSESDGESEMDLGRVVVEPR